MNKENKDNINNNANNHNANQETNDMAALAANREKTIVRTSVIGIITNVLLAAFKPRSA